MQRIKKYLIVALQKRFFCRQLPVPQNPRSILIIRQHDQLGDFLMSTPLFRELKKKFPHSTIAVVVKPYTRFCVENNPHVDEIIEFEPLARKWTLVRLFSFIKKIRKSYDLAIIVNTPSHSFTSDLIAFFSGARFRLGMRPLPIDNPASYDFFYHGTVDREYPRINQSLENCTVLKAFGILTSDPREELFISTKENEWARTQLELLHIHKEPVILIPDAHIVNRIWPAEHFIELGKKILKHLPLLVLWGPRQEHLGEAVLRPLEKMGAKTIRNTTIREMAALFAHSNMVICNDTGSLHVSAAIGARTFGLHGPTDPYIYQAQGDHITAIKSPTGRIEDISVDQVLKEIQSILTGP